MLDSRVYAAAVACFIAVFALAAPSGAAPIGYGVDGDSSPNMLFTVDLATGESTTIGSGLGAGFTDVEGLGFNPLSGILYAIDDDGNALLSIDILTGVGTLIGPLGVKVYDPGFAVSADGVGFVASRFDGNNLYAVDLETGVATFVGAMEQDIEGLAFIDNTLYGIGPASDSLFTIDTETAEALLVGAFGPTILTVQAGLASDGTFLYAGDDSGNYLRIDPETGEGELITMSGRNVEGLALQPTTSPQASGETPIPEPSVIAMFGVGLAGLYFMRRRRDGTPGAGAARHHRADQVAHMH